MANNAQRFCEVVRTASSAVERLQAEIAGFQMDAGKPRSSARYSVLLCSDMAETIDKGISNIEEALTAAMSLLPSLDESPQQTRPSEWIKADDLVNRFRSLVNLIQRGARSQQQEGEMGVTMQSLYVEMKGFITLQQNQARITTPTLTQTTDPGLLSTIRMEFAAIPVVRSSRVETENSTTL